MEGKGRRKNEIPEHDKSWGKGVPNCLPIILSLPPVKYLMKNGFFLKFVFFLACFTVYLKSVYSKADKSNFDKKYIFCSLYIISIDYTC